MCPSCRIVYTRTLAILAKSDVNDQDGKLDKLAKILANEDYPPLSKGYIAVRNRANEELLHGRMTPDQIAEERRFLMSRLVRETALNYMGEQRELGTIF